jgi:hypothetical protein
MAQNTADTAAKGLDQATQAAADVADQAYKIASDFIDRRPLTALFGAFALGFIYAKIR